jgi:hypothetical protein
MIENTQNRSPIEHVVGLMGGSESYITGMEAAGQRQLVESDRLPTDAPWSELEALGFVRGAEVPGDAMFTEATLPAGWKREPSDHSMWSHIVDERGIRRVSVFYKAAFYDRSAHASIVNVAASLVTDLLYGDGPAALPAQWGALTDEERASYSVQLAGSIVRDSEAIAGLPALDAEGRYTARIERARAARALVEGVSRG